MLVIGIRWKALSDEDKVPYEALAHADKTRFKEEMAVYNEQKAIAAEDDEHNETNLNSRKMLPKGKTKSKDAPKRAMTAYVFYTNEMRLKVKEEIPDLSSMALLKELGGLSISLLCPHISCSHYEFYHCPCIVGCARSSLEGPIYRRQGSL